MLSFRCVALLHCASSCMFRPSLSSQPQPQHRFLKSQHMPKASCLESGYLSEACSCHSTQILDSTLLQAIAVQGIHLNKLPKWPKLAARSCCARFSEQPFCVLLSCEVSGDFAANLQPQTLFTQLPLFTGLRCCAKKLPRKKA